MQTPLEVTAKGAIAGLAGTAVVSVLMPLLPQVLTSLGLMEPPPGPKEEPTEQLAEDVAEGVFDTGLDEDTKQAAGQAIHWGYGTGWGAVYGIVQGSLHLPHLLHGTIFGGLIATIASTLVPAMGVMPPPSKLPMALNAGMLGINLAYGWVTALVFHLLGGD